MASSDASVTCYTDSRGLCDECHVRPRARRPGAKFCSNGCRYAHANKANTVRRQGTLSFQPPAVALIPLAVPPHDPGKREALKRAARHILALLQDGCPHSRHELARVGGNRYIARLAEIRAALDGRAVVVGPRAHRGCREVEPMRDGCECYRLEWRA